MELKGTTTIQLFEQGKEVHRVEETNLITNVYKNFMEQVIGGFHFPPVADNIRAVIRDYAPITLTKGVFLFDTSQTESVDTTFITGGNCVGHAGGAYAGTDSTRGNWNQTETGSITNGYKRVWDFATNQANGTINSVCLTTDRGGNYGYGNATTYQGINEYSTFALSDITAISMGFSYSNQFKGFTSTYKYLAGFSADIKKAYFQDGYSGTVYLRIFATPNISALGFLQIPQMDLNAPTNTYSKNLGTNEYLWLCVLSGVLHGVLYNSSTKAAYLKTYSDLFTELTSISLTGSKTLGTPPSFGIVNGYLFVFSGSTNVIRKYNASTGSYIEDFAITGGSVQNMQQFNNQFIVFWHGSSSLYYLALYDGATLYKWFAINSNSFNGMCSLYSSKCGILITADSTPNLNAQLLAPVLFTVNNLGTPVVKTNAQTMKVTYTITWG